MTMESGALELELGPGPSWGPDGIFVVDAIVNEKKRLSVSATAAGRRPVGSSL